MYKILKTFGLSMLGLGAVMTGADAVTARAGGAIATPQVQRMPTMTVFPGGATGNIVQPNVTPTPTTPTTPEVEEEAVEYSKNACMKDILACIENGALPNGLNDMFNVDLRNSIINGMNLCALQVESCIANVTENGQSVYDDANDVWQDFNSREVQPAYYSFVLRRTGLTPNQAENTCWLLDRNVYGSSFAAINATGKVTSEYDQQINPYNDTAGSEKFNSQGLNVNDDGKVDAERGHYARWDAVNGECLVRIAAYNKDKAITNETLWGLMGNKDSAEAWVSAGDNFECDKDLFGFYLMRDTANVALIGGTATVVGTGTAAIIEGSQKAKEADSASNFDCANKQSLADLNDKLRTHEGILLAYVEETLPLTENSCNELLEYNKRFESAKTVIAKEDKTTDSRKFHSLISLDAINSVVCGEGAEDCTDERDDIDRQVTEFDKVSSVLSKGYKEKSKSFAGTAWTAGIGAGATGVATAITAFVESNNISCRVGDGLDTVAFNKSYTVDSLKDYYVKWDLELPDTILLEAVDSRTWYDACAEITNLSDCDLAQMKYDPRDASKDTEYVDGACMASGNGCVGNTAVIESTIGYEGSLTVK